MDFFKRGPQTQTYTSPQYGWRDFVKWPRLLHGHSQGPLPSGQPHKSSSIYPSESNQSSHLLEPRSPGPPAWRSLRVTGFDLWPARTLKGEEGVTRCQRGSEILMRVTVLTLLGSATVWTLINTMTSEPLRIRGDCWWKQTLTRVSSTYLSVVNMARRQVATWWWTRSPTSVIGKTP